MDTNNQTPPKIYSKISDILNDLEAVPKTRKNQQQGYNFRGIDEMYNCVHPLFSKHRVFITSNVLSESREERQTKSGGSLIYTIMKVEFRFFAEDGSYVTSIMSGEAMDSADKSTNKAMSAALKYALMQMFLIPTEGKKDTEEDDYEVKPKAAPAKTTTTAPPKLPVMNEKQFQLFVVRLAKGDNIEATARKQFSFSSAQEKKIKEILEELNKNKSA